MELKLTLNTNAKPAPSERLKTAAAKRTAHQETLDDAWLRILATNNSDGDRAKLLAVRQAFAEGVLGREPAAANKRFSKAEALRLYKELAALQRESKLKALVANTPANYVLVLDVETLHEMIGAIKREPIIAVDTETTGLDVYVDVIVGVSFTLPNADKHYYVPVTPTEDDRVLDATIALEAMRPVIESRDIRKVMFNAVFDIQMFRRHGITFNGLAWDGLTAMHLLDENLMSYKLKDLAPKYLGAESDTFAELFGKDAKFAEVPLEIALVYAAKDTHLTYDLYEFQRKHLEKFPEMYEYYTTVEVPLLNVIADLEANGYVLDLDFAVKYGNDLRAQSDALYIELMDALKPYVEPGADFNINSTQQLRPALSKAIGKPLANLDAKRTLKPLRKQFDVIDKLLEYRRITKLSSTYIDSLPRKQNSATKRWHSRFNPMGTVTGRFSSGKDEESGTDQQFNVQNQPADARNMFVAPQGKVLVGADFKAQEIRCAAYMSGESVLIDAFKVGRDPYANMASNYYKRPYDEVNKMPDGSDTPERKGMKVVWLATLYGMSIFSLADMLGVSKDEAKKFQTELFESMPQLNAWLKENERFVSKNGYVWADKKYRKRRLPDAKLKRKQIPYGKYNDPKFEADRKHNSAINRALRQSNNAKIQGSSSIQTKVTMIRGHEECVKRDGWCLWASVHDEIIFEIPADFTREDIAVIERVMLESYVFGEVENGTDIEVMTRWGNGVPVDEWFATKAKEANA